MMDAKSMSDIWRLLQCPQCLQCPMTPPVYMCESGHHMCCSCSQRVTLINDVTYPPSEDPESNVKDVPCFHCGERMTLMRNIFCEKLIKVVSSSCSMPDVRCVPLDAKDNGVVTTMIFERKPSTTCTALPDRLPDRLPRPPPTTDQSKDGSTPTDQGDQRDKGKKSSGTNIYRSGSCETRSSNTGSYASATFSDGSSFSGKRRSTNHMPLRCPKIPCGRTVASSGLILHFHFDHKDVPHIDLGRNDELNVWITPTVIPFEIERCLALLLLQEEGSCSVTQAVNAKLDHLKCRTPFILMGTRLPCHLNTTMQLHRNALTDFPLNSDCLVNDFLLIWVVGMEADQFTCKIVATDIKDSTRSITYIGPIMSVRDIFSPREILATGNCIILPPGYVNILTESGGGFDLNVTIV